MTYSSIYTQDRQREEERKLAPQRCPHCGTPINQDLRPWDKVRYHCGSDRCRKAQSRANIALRKRKERDEAEARIEEYAAKLPAEQGEALSLAKKLLMQADYDQGHNTMLAVIEVIEAQKCRHDRISVLIDNANAAKRRADKAEEHNQQLERLYTARIAELEAELHVYQSLENAVHNVAQRQLAVQPDPALQPEHRTAPPIDPDRAQTLATLAALGIRPVEQALAEAKQQDDTEGSEYGNQDQHEDTER